MTYLLQPRLRPLPSQVSTEQTWDSAPTAEAAELQPPVAQQVLTWMIFWPLLCLIARQSPYFSGPARDAMAIQQGAAAGPGTDYHASLYINMAFQAAFALSSVRAIWTTLRRNPLIALGPVLIFASALWSDSAGNTIRMGIEVCLCTFFTCYLSARMTTERLLRLLMLMGVASALLSALFALALPSYGIFAGYGGGAWNGICDHKNTLGLSMTWLLTPVFFVDGQRPAHRLLYAMLILLVIGMSQSRGAWMYTAGAICFAGGLHLIHRLRRNEAMLLVLIALVLFAVLGVIGWRSIDTIAPMMGKSASMSGRTDIYREVWKSILKEPSFGYGYGGFWGVNPEADRIGLAIGWANIGYSESGILELGLQLGFVGIALVLLMLGRAAWQGVRLLRSPYYSPRVGWFLTLLFLAVVTNVDAGWLLVSGTLDWPLILIACIGLENETRRARTAQDESALRNLTAEPIENLAAIPA